jgi:c-di-GMP-binding flagellar brake protein YcgR
MAGAGQKRAAYRATIEFPVTYVVDGRKGTRTASANDLSAGGLRLLGDEDFTKDTVIDFHIALPNEVIEGIFQEKEVDEPQQTRVPRSSSSRFGLAGFGKSEVGRVSLGTAKKRVKVKPKPFEPMDIAGKIVIAFYSTRSNRFAHGVRFLHLPKKLEDEIQRFIHLYQLKQLHDRSNTVPE